jgi:hypothetical protein
VVWWWGVGGRGCLWPPRTDQRVAEQEAEARPLGPEHLRDELRGGPTRSPPRLLPRGWPLLRTPCSRWEAEDAAPAAQAAEKGDSDSSSSDETAPRPAATPAPSGERRAEDSRVLGAPPPAPPPPISGATAAAASAATTAAYVASNPGARTPPPLGRNAGGGAMFPPRCQPRRRD